MLLIVVLGATDLRIFYGCWKKMTMREFAGAPIRLYSLDGLGKVEGEEDSR